MSLSPSFESVVMSSTHSEAEVAQVFEYLALIRIRSEASAEVRREVWHFNFTTKAVFEHPG